MSCWIPGISIIPLEKNPHLTRMRKKWTGFACCQTRLTRGEGRRYDLECASPEPAFYSSGISGCRRPNPHWSAWFATTANVNFAECPATRHHFQKTTQQTLRQSLGWPNYSCQCLGMSILLTANSVKMCFRDKLHLWRTLAKYCYCIVPIQRASFRHFANVLVRRELSHSSTRRDKMKTELVRCVTVFTKWITTLFSANQPRRHFSSLRNIAPF